MMSENLVNTFTQILLGRRFEGKKIKGKKNPDEYFSIFKHLDRL